MVHKAAVMQSRCVPRIGSLCKSYITDAIKMLAASTFRQPSALRSLSLLRDAAQRIAAHSVRSCCLNIQAWQCRVLSVSGERAVRSAADD